MITAEKIKLFAEVTAKIEKYDNPEYIKERWLTEEDLAEIKKGLNDEIDTLKEDFQDYVLHKFQERQEEKILSVGIEEEIKRLQDLKKPHDNRIKNIDKWLEYLMGHFQLDKVETALWTLKYGKSQVLWISDRLNTELPEEFLKLFPEDLLKKTANIDLEQEGMEEKLKKIGVEIIPSLGNKNDIKSWLKTLKKEELKAVKEFVEIRQSKTFKIE